MGWLTNIPTLVNIGAAISVIVAGASYGRQTQISKLDKETIAAYKERLSVEEAKNEQLEERIKSKDAHIKELSKIAQQTPAIVELTAKVADLTAKLAGKADK